MAVGGQDRAVWYTGRMSEPMIATAVLRIQMPLRLLAVGLFVVALPLFLISTNVRLIVNWPRLYSNGFDKYDIPSRTGIERPELILAGEQIRDYFNNDDELIDFRIVVGGILRSLFNSREILHMKDVKGLVQGVYTLQLLSGLYVAAFVVARLALAWRTFPLQLVRYLAYGGGLTVGLVALAGAATTVDFEEVFNAFHVVSFSNDLWQLDPSRDYLIAMFPESFFFDATMWIAGLTIAQAVALTVPRALLRWGPGRLSAHRGVLTADSASTAS